jgi:hypothetical protein
MKITIEETTVRSGASAEIEIFIDDKKVKIMVPKEVKAHFTNQFARPNPTPLQKKRYITLMSLLRAAYKAGQASK